jgi:hypothetical protein
MKFLMLASLDHKLVLFKPSNSGNNILNSGASDDVLRPLLRRKHQVGRVQSLFS